MFKTFAAASVAVAALLAPAAALAFNAPTAPYRVGPGPHGPAMAPPAMAAAPLLLPDFPAEARPGECWTRVPAGSGAPMGVAPAGQPVWTLKRGHGPEAVWQFDRRPGDGAMGRGFEGPYEWVRVACSPADRAFAEAPPAPPMPPVPPEPPMVHAPAPHGHAGAMHQGPMQHGPMQHGPGHQGGMPHGQMQHGEMHREMHERHMQQGQMQHGHTQQHGYAQQHGHMQHGPMMHGPMHQPPHGGMAMGPLAPHGAYAGAPMPPMMEPAYAPPPSPPRWFGDRMLTWAGKTPW